MPVDALKGKALNVLIDDYLEEGVRDANDLTAQAEELAYISEMANRREARLSPEERKAVWNMITYIREKLQGIENVCPNPGLPQRGFHYSPAISHA